jgi:SAM-dependent methyltransferase
MNLVKRINRRLKLEVNQIIGPKRYCNICQNKFKGKYLPIDPYYIENFKESGYPYSFDDGETLNYNEYTCPFCQSSDRDRLYALYIDNYTINSATYKLLDIAPSNPLQKYLKQKSNIQYRCADLSMEGVDDHVNIMDMHIYPDNKFDIFICSHVLEHVIDDKLAMRELRRILKIGGVGICMVPIILPLKEIDEDTSLTDPNERWRRFGQDDHVRLYSKQGFIDRLIEAKFKVQQITVKDFNLNQFKLLGISPKSVLYIVSK